MNILVARMLWNNFFIVLESNFAPTQSMRGSDGWEYLHRVPISGEKKASEYWRFVVDVITELLKVFETLETLREIAHQDGMQSSWDFLKWGGFFQEHLLKRLLGIFQRFAIGTFFFPLLPNYSNKNANLTKERRIRIYLNILDQREIWLSICKRLFFRLLLQRETWF